jgi:hypothetical protein
VDSYDAILETGTLVGGWSKWSAYVALPPGFSGSTMTVGITAEDVYGGITETVLTKSYGVTRLVPFSLLSSGNGTVSCSPEPDENGFVPMGARIVVTAKPLTGNILRRIETVIDGQPQPVPTSRGSSLSVQIRGDTSVTVLFEPNPYALVGGRNRTAYSLMEASSAITGSFVDGVFPLTSLQVSVTAVGGFSGRLVVGRSAYSVAGRFDADGFYSATLAGRVPCLNWKMTSGSSVDATQLPAYAMLPMILQIWVDTTQGLDLPRLRVCLADGFGANLGGTLLPAGSLDYNGTALFTGTFSKSTPMNTSGSQGANGWATFGVPTSNPASGGSNAGALPGSGGYYSISARRSGSATVLGMLPNGEKFTSATWLLDQDESSPRSLASVRSLSAVGTNGAFGFTASLSTPFSQNSGESGAWARREAWYPGNRGPVFETGSIYSAGFGYRQALLPVFAREWNSEATPFVPTGSASMQVSLSPPGVPSTQAFSVTAASGKVSVSVLNFDAIQDVRLSLSFSTGVMTGSVQLPSGKRLSLQGVFIQNPMDTGGVWVTSDGRRFISNHSTLLNSSDSW